MLPIVYSFSWYIHLDNLFHITSQIIATSHEFFTPKGSWGREVGPRLFQANLGWWNTPPKNKHGTPKLVVWVDVSPLPRGIFRCKMFVFRGVLFLAGLFMVYLNPYIMVYLLKSLYNWVVFHHLYNPTNQRFTIYLFSSILLALWSTLQRFTFCSATNDSRES